MLAAVWEFVALDFLRDMDLNKTPELIALAGRGEDAATLSALSRDDLLLRWLNHQLVAGGYHGHLISNFGDLVRTKILKSFSFFL